eukprot:11154402-Lingulodinium_polyedra.AAC.1
MSATQITKTTRWGTLTIHRLHPESWLPEFSNNARIRRARTGAPVPTAIGKPSTTADMNSGCVCVF